MIAEIAEPRIGANVPRPFPCMCGGGLEQDYHICKFEFGQLDKPRADLKSAKSYQA